MLSFKEYLQEQTEESNDLSFIDFMLENYDPYETFDDISQLDEDYEAPQSATIKAVQRGVVEHMGNYKNSSTKEKDILSKAANEYFKNKDFRTVKEKIDGQIAAKARAKANQNLLKRIPSSVTGEGYERAFKRLRNGKEWIPETNFESPLKINGKITTKTDKHLSSGTGYRIPEGFPNAGMGATVSALRLTPGNANLGDGKYWKSCPKATLGCGGGRKIGEAGVGEDALCLATKGTDSFVNSRKSKLARTRALFDPEALPHFTAKLAKELEYDHKKAKANNAVHHFRPNDSSDADTVTSAVNKHYPEIVTYGYSKHLPHDHNSLNNHVTRSDTGPEYDDHGIRESSLHDAKNKTIDHLMSNKNARAYMVLAQERLKKNIGEDIDATTHIHTVRYHKYDENGRHIGYEDFDADRNVSNGDLRPYDKPSERNLVSNIDPKDPRKKGAVTITDISGATAKELGENGAANSMVHPIDSNHIQPDPENPKKNIYHVDPPNGDYTNPTGKLQKIRK